MRRAYGLPIARRWRSRRCTSASRSCPISALVIWGAFVLRAASGPVRDRARHGPADRRAHRDRRGRIGGAGCAPPLPAFVFERVTRSQGDEIVEYVRSVYRGDRYRLVTELRRGARAFVADGARCAQRRLEPHAAFARCTILTPEWLCANLPAVASGLNQFRARTASATPPRDRSAGRPCPTPMEVRHKHASSSSRCSLRLSGLRPLVQSCPIPGQHHRLAPDRRAERLARARRFGEQPVPEGASRCRRQRAVPDVANPSAEVRRVGLE